MTDTPNPPRSRPGNGVDVWDQASDLIHAFARFHEAHKAAKAARRRTPEAIATRSAAATRGWEKRRAREAAQAVEEARSAWRPDIPDGPWCEDMSHDGTGGEILCARHPAHEGDHEDAYGTTWDNEDHGE